MKKTRHGLIALSPVGDRGVVVSDRLYQRACRAFDETDLSASTRKEYKDRIKNFLEFAQERGGGVNSFLFYKDYLAQSNFKANTKNQYLKVAKLFLKILFEKEELPKDLTRGVKAFSVGRKHKVEGLNEDEISVLMAAMKRLPDTKYNSRLKAIISLLALQGLRQIEVTRLDFDDIDFVGGAALVQGKGRDDKEGIALQSETVKCLQSYVALNKISSGALFSSPRESKRLSTRQLRHIVKKTLTILGIEKTTHGFRHYFATKLLKVYKGDLLAVKRYTRHKNIDMLEVYNDNINDKADLPRFYKTFEDIKLS